MPAPCCSTTTYDDFFDRKHAEQKLRELRRKGPPASTIALADALAKHGIVGRTVLDIGGGVGAVHQMLLERGAASAVDVDASNPYLNAARDEAARRGLSERIRFEHGNFVAIAGSIAPADLVALDRVVCCYPEVDALVRAAAERTRRRLAIVLPPDNVIAKAVIGLENLWLRLTRNEFRAYVHPHARVTAAARAAGLEPAGGRRLGIWELLVFERPILSADSP